ncbi:hypothetical protein R6Q59_020675 [Mikania micrantha]
MASSSFILSIVLFLITIINTVAVTSMLEREYNSLLSALRYRGYHVFANAISTTDLHYDIINGGNFTFFAPINSVLYTLDTSMSAGDYSMTMRFHVVPRRLSLSDLRELPYGLTSFPTLLHDHEIHIVNPLSLPLPVTVEGVEIAIPDLYYDAHIVVHGLESVIGFRSVNDAMKSTSMFENLTPMDVRRETFAPSPQVAVQVAPTPPRTSIVTGIDTVASPLPVSETSYMPFSDGSQAQRHHQAETRSVTIIQSHQLPETKSESITQSHQLPDTKSESITRSHPLLENRLESVTQSHHSPETRSESVTQSHHSPVSKSITRSQQVPDTRSESVTQSHHSPQIYFESVNQPPEEHISIATRPEFIPQNIHHVSLAMKSISNAAEDFMQADGMIIDCPVADDDREQLSIANIRRDDPNTRDLYDRTKMTCAHGNIW